jgi:hypothetical protein
MKKYFIHDGHSHIGPFTLEELQSQKLNSETPIWYEGLSNWTITSNLAELSGFFKNSSAPPPFTKDANGKKLESENESHEEYLSAMEQYFPSKSKKITKSAIIIGISIGILVAIIFWLINQNNQNSDTISDLQKQIANQKQVEIQKQDQEQQVNDALNQKNLLYRKDWDKFIKQIHSEPQINYTWGGISAFQVAVSNKTEYILDQVDLKVQYIRKNGDLWEQKTISFFNVSANSNEIKVAPASLNGVKVKVDIEKVMCKKMEFCFPTYNGDRNDPYFCK